MNETPNDIVNKIIGKKKVNWWKVIAMLLIIIVGIACLYFVYLGTLQQGYNVGYNQGMLYTSQTGNLFYQEGNETKTITLNQYAENWCRNVIEQQGVKN